MTTMMTCGSCKQTKASSEFTKLNMSKDGTRGLCKECKRQRDREYRARKDKEQSKLRHFDLVPDMIQRDTGRARVGVLVLNRVTDRATAKHFLKQPNHGLKAILGELNEPYEFCSAEFINSYEFVLVSLTSVMDVENLIYTMERYAPETVRAKIIVGGFGVGNIKLLTPYIDIAVFGRAEGQINEILAGQDFDNVWRKDQDPKLEGRYAVRQPRYLVDGELGVGCRNKCRFCQYTFIRRPLVAGQEYNPGTQLTIQETDWAALEVDKQGRYTTAWDGWSQETRRRVAKPITDQDIADKLFEIDNRGIDGTVNIKVFQIVGYPWETPETVNKDIAAVGQILKEIDRQIKTSIILAFFCTPFGPEPLTPMQYEPGNIHVNWREAIETLDVYRGENITAFITPTISGPFALMKRMFIHRAERTDLKRFKAIVFTSRLNRMPERWKVPWLLKHGHIKEEMFGRLESAAFDYLYVEHRGEAVNF